MKVKEKANLKAKLKAKVRARVKVSTEVIPADYRFTIKKVLSLEHITIEVCPKCVFIWPNSMLTPPNCRMTGLTANQSWF